MHGDNIFTALSAFSSMFVDNPTARLSVHHLDLAHFSLEPICNAEYCYSKTCVKRPLKNRQNKDHHDKW